MHIYLPRKDIAAVVIEELLNANVAEFRHLLQGEKFFVVHRGFISFLKNVFAALWEYLKCSIAGSRMDVNLDEGASMNMIQKRCRS